MGTATADGVSVYYEVNGEGPAVVFLHGSGGNHCAWWQQVADLRRDHTVVTLDLRGFGNSSTPETIDARAFPGEVLAVLDDAGIERAVLVGQSIGATTALKVALAAPERVPGVVLAHSLGGIDHPELKQRARDDRAEAEKLPVLDRLLSKPFQEQQPALTFLFRQMGTFNRAKMATIENAHADGPTLEQVAASGVAVCFLTGERDAVLKSSTVALAHELVPGSTLTIVPDGPHSMYWEEPALFNGAVRSFLDEVYGGGS